MKDNFFIYLYELGCKGTKKNGDEQKNSVFSLQNTQQAPVRRLVKVLCMRDLLYFHSHDIVGLAVTEDKEMVVVDKLLCITIWCSISFYRGIDISITQAVRF